MKRPEQGWTPQLDEGLSEDQLILKRQYLEKMMDNPFPKVHYGPSYIPSHCDLNDFIDLIKKVLDEDQKNKKEKIILIDSFSKTNMFEDPAHPGKDAVGVVTYSLIKKVPGTLAQTNTPGDMSRREVRPSLRAVTYGEIDKPGEVTFHFGQYFDNIIEFSIWARSNTEANEFADFFETLMEKNRQFFAYYGIMKYYFLERESDAIIREGDSVVHVRPIRYWVRTEKNFETTEQSINNVIVKITTT